MTLSDSGDDPKIAGSEIQPELIFNTYWAAAGTFALSTAVEIELFTAIHENQTTVEKIAKHLSMPLRPIRILLDALVGMGFLTKSKITYKLSPEAKTYLVKGAPRYLGSALLRAEKNFQAWVRLKEAVKTGKPVFQPIDPQSNAQFFSDLARDIFPMSYASAISIAKKIGVGKSLKNLTILDLACGSGAWSIAFALNDPSSRVVANDLPEVMELTRYYVKRFRLENQYGYLPGNLQEVDLGRSQYDVIILGHICHGIGENESRKLIKRAFEALRPGGRLLIGEVLPNDLKTADQISLLFGLEMLLHSPAGDVFTAKEFKRWLSLVGFKKVNVLKALYPTQVVVGIK